MPTVGNFAEAKKRRENKEIGTNEALKKFRDLGDTFLFNPFSFANPASSPFPSVASLFP